MKYFFYSIIFLLVTVLISCEHDHEHDTSDSSTPLFTISSPADSQVYSDGDTIRIKGTLTDNELHELNLDILRKSDSASLYHEVISVHELTSYNIHSYWIASVSDTTEAWVVLKAWDHKPNVAIKRISITINK